jgi:hypothetical protein
MKFQDIPQFPKAYYNIHVNLDYVEMTLKQWGESVKNNGVDMLELNPEWQRGHVWTKKQKISFMEFMLMGGTTGMEIYFNCSSWMEGFNTKVYCVDGLQRLQAALDFINNRIPAFGTFYKDFEDRIRLTGPRFVFNMLNLKKKKDLLNLYIMFNSGGTPHNAKEIARVQAMMDATPENETI